MRARGERRYHIDLRRRLRNSGWEIVWIDEDTDCWADVHWFVRSTRQAYGLELVVTFLVDPMYEGGDKRSAVWSVSATINCRTSRLDAAGAIATVYLQKGYQTESLQSLVDALDAYRNSRPQSRDRVS